MSMQMSSVTRAVTALSAILLLSACVYSIDIQQGNFLEPKDIDRVAVGMTRVQVRSLLGTPMVSDPFEGARWDYVYYLKRNRSSEITQRHFIVFFETDKVSRIQRSDQAQDATEAIKAPDTPDATAETATEPAQDSAEPPATADESSPP